MTETEALIAEVRQLRADVARPRVRRHFAALMAQGIVIDAVASAARATLPPPTAHAPALLPYDDAAKAVIEAAAAGADTMGDARVSELHLLLALSTNEVNDGVLRHFGFDASAARSGHGCQGC